MNFKLNKKYIWIIRLLEYKKEKDSEYAKGLG